VILQCNLPTMALFNLGISTGPALCKQLRTMYGDKVACQGISTADGYSSSIFDNMIQPKGTSDKSIDAATKMFTLAHTKCPASLLVFSGYR
jgi:cutinase